MEKLVLVKRKKYKTGLCIFLGFILYALENYVWNLVKSDKSVHVDPSMYVLTVAFIAAWVFFGLRMFFMPSPVVLRNYQMVSMKSGRFFSNI